jgi:hypothetical protein
MRKSWIALLVMMPCLFAYGDENKCKEVSGGIFTNFLTALVIRIIGRNSC